jgi:hypothetical protein
LNFIIHILDLRFEILDLRMDSPTTAVAQNILYELWFSVAESIFKQVCEVTELDEEQIQALKSVALRPNDFQIEIE